MNRTLLAAFAASALLGSAPVQAAPLDWSGAKAAFDEGRKPGNGPTTEDDYSGCTAFWSAWNDAVNAGQVPTGAAAQVSEDLVAPNANMMTFGWLVWIENGEDPDASTARLEELLPAARAQVAAALGGSGEALTMVMAVLGACQLPEDG